MVKRGKSYRIRVNFCPKSVEGRLESPLVCRQKHYIEGVERCGAKLDPATRTIVWDVESAKRYALYVLLHEIGHVAYAEKDLSASGVARSTSKEEDWCDAYSAALMQKIDTSE
jgi:hypothetical protein